MKGLCGISKIKPNLDRGSIYLIHKVFRFYHCEDGSVRLFIGTKIHNVGYLSFKAYSKF